MCVVRAAVETQGRGRVRALVTWRLACAVVLLAASVHAQEPSPAPPLTPADPADTRLVLVPTARTLPAGDVTLTLLGPIPIVQVGLADRFSLGAGPFWFALDEGIAPVLIVPKLQVIRRPGWQAAVGALHLAGLSDASVGLAYGVVTKGTSDGAVTGGIGYVYLRSEGEGGAAPAVLAGAERRISRRVKFVADAYVFDFGGWATAVLRRTGEHFALDAGVIVFGGDGAFGGPTVMLTWRF